MDLWFLDQSGFAPTVPTGYPWGRKGVRLVVPDEAPQGRRVNVGGAVAPDDPGSTRFIFATRRKPEGRYDAAAHLAFVERLAAAGAADRPCVIGLDTYAVHHRQGVQAAIPDLAERPITFWDRPPDRPELNPIEPRWKQIKHQDLPERSHPTDVALQAAVEAALANRARMLGDSTYNLPRSA